MDLIPVISDLKTELAQLDEAIAIIERLRGPRRGRPPNWLRKPPASAETPRRVFSAETRRKMAQSQKKRWAQRKVA